jgi:hypothetical protein
VATILLDRSVMSRAQHRGRRFAPPTVLSRCCAAWIVLLVLSSFAAPFAVSHAREIVGANPNTRKPTPYKDDYEDWVMQGEAPSIEPTPPTAATIIAMATSPAVRIDRSTTAYPVTMATAVVPANRGPITLVLRV